MGIVGKWEEEEKNLVALLEMMVSKIDGLENKDKQQKSIYW